MQFFNTLFLGASALAAFAAAQSSSLFFTNAPSSVAAGSPVALSYQAPSGNPVTIQLRYGDSNNLQNVSILTDSATGGTYTWIPSNNLVNRNNYALQITQGSETNYSPEFSLTGGLSKAAATSSGSTLVSTRGSMTTKASSAATPYAMGNTTVPAMPTASAPTTLLPYANSTGSPIVPPANTVSVTQTAPGVTTTALPTGGASQLHSSFALIVGAVAAVVALN